MDGDGEVGCEKVDKGGVAERGWGVWHLEIGLGAQIKREPPVDVAGIDSEM